MGSSGCIIRIALALLLPALVLCQIQNNEAYKEEFRLPGDIYPIQQWVKIYTKLVVDDFCFWGITEIKIKVVIETSQIVLHSCALNIHTQKVYIHYVDSEEPLPYGQIEFNTDFEFMIIPLQQSLPVGAEVIVYIPFDAPLQDIAYGYFRTSYEDAQGNEIWFSATYFDAGKARTAFPCLDEPAYKTVFSISLAHSQEFTAISNMDIKETTEIQEDGLEGWILTVFNDTPYLSSYLVAMMICQFQYIEIPNMSVPTRVWARTEVIDQMKIVERTVESVFPAFVDLFSVQLKLEHLFIIAVPKYMFNQESWGCLMIEEADVVYNENFHTIYDPTFIAADISHLLAHLWCGDLVTMEWWSEIFLADGLAFYYQEVGVSIFFDMRDYQDIRFCTIHRIEMNDDSSVEDSQAIVAPIEFPSNLLQQLTELLYRKSYLYIRQLMMIISQEAFLNGLINYLNDYQYGVARLSDFLEELNKAGKNAQTLAQDFDLNVAMERWSYGKGYPLVKAEVDYDNQAVYLSQIRFIYETRLGPDDRAQIEKECWPIPISYVFSSNLNFDDYLVKDWLTCDSYLEVFLENFTQQDFILFNVKLHGLYRVTYSDAMWLAIADFLRNENQFAQIDVLNRMQIISDTFEVAWPGYLGYFIPFKIAPYLAFETMEQPLRTALYSLRDIRDRLQRTELLVKFNVFVREFLEPLYRRYNDVSLVPDSIIEARFKLLVDSWAGTYQVAPCLEQSFQLLMQWYNTPDPDNNNPININVRETAYCYGLQQANDELWNWMFERFYGAADDDERSRILFGLGCTANPQILADFIQWSLDPNTIDPIWFTTVFLSVYYSEQPFNFTVIFNFLTNNYQAIIQVLDEDWTTFCALLAYIGTMIDKGDELDQFQAFLNSAPVGSCQSDIDAAIRDALNNISWHDMHDSELYDLLSPIPTEDAQMLTTQTANTQGTNQ